MVQERDAASIDNRPEVEEGVAAGSGVPQRYRRRPPNAKSGGNSRVNDCLRMYVSN